MATGFFEWRKQAARGSDSVAADMMRHLHTRQNLGKTLVICDQPTTLLSADRKQWLKLSRMIQKRRASTLNADKILKYTRMITRMQHMHFTAKSPLERPEADVYFTTPEALQSVPLRCFSVYVTVPLDKVVATSFVSLLPDAALVIDYQKNGLWRDCGLLPKGVLDDQVGKQWQRVQQFMAAHDIVIGKLLDGPLRDAEAMDDALDTLLMYNHAFLQVADDFQRALELARPIKVTKELRQEYNTLSLLAHRVQALGSSTFSQHFLETYNEDDSFFLYNPDRGRFVDSGESLAEAVSRHELAGRFGLALALRQAYEKQAASYHCSLTTV